MKIIPEQQSSLITQSTPRFKVDAGAFCFFILGMFLSAMVLHLSGIIPNF